MRGAGGWFRSVAALAILPALAAVCPAAPAGQALFESGRLLPLPSKPAAVKIADFNGDGLLDAAAALVSGNSDNVAVFLNAGPSGLGSPAYLSAGDSPIFLESGDLNGDGDADLVAVNNGSASLSIFLSGDSGKLSPVNPVPTGLRPRTVLLADWNGDGLLDAAASNYASFSLSIYLGDGKGGFAAADPLPTGDNPHSLAGGDFDGDAVADLAVSHRRDTDLWGSVALFRGLGSGKFAAAAETTLSSLAAVPRWLAAGDFDRDGRLDLAAIASDGRLALLKNAGGKFDVRELDLGGAASGELSGFLASRDLDGDGALDLIYPAERNGEHGLTVGPGIGDGRFREPETYFLAAETAAADFGDLDGDGLLDAAAAHAAPPAVSIHRGAAGGRFQARGTIPLTQLPLGAGALDFDGDGLKDLAVLDSKSLALFRNEGGRKFFALAPQQFAGSSFRNLASIHPAGPMGGSLALADSAGKVTIVSIDPRGMVSSIQDHTLAGKLPTLVAAGMLDSDGLPDLAANDLASDAITLILSTRPMPVSLPATRGPTAIEAGDLDGDGISDLCVAGLDEIIVITGAGDGNFLPGRRILDEKGASALRIADLDRDGRPDLAATFRRRIAILLGAAGAPPLARVDLQAPADEEIRLLEVADLDGDGLQDLLTASPGGVRVFRGLAGGIWGGAEAYPTGPSPSDLLASDLDGDGRIDCLTTNTGSRSISILYGAASVERPFRRGDADASGAADLTDAIVVLTALFLGGRPLQCPDAADSNDDGEVELTDAVFLILALYAGGEALHDPGPAVCGPDPSVDALAPCLQPCLP